MSQSGSASKISLQSSSPAYYLSIIAPAPSSQGAIFLFDFFYGYNGDMMNEKYNAPNSACCGRPFPKAEPKCNYNSCCLNEYNYAMPACIRNKRPDCMAKAVIPATTVETADGITNLANCFVHVTSINTTFYIDDKHRPMIIWAGNVETEAPKTAQTEEEFIAFIKSFNLKEQFLYVKMYNQDNSTNVIGSFYFDKTGKVYWAGEFEEILEV